MPKARTTQMPLGLPVQPTGTRGQSFERVRQSLEVQSKGGLLTTGQAANVLGIRSVNTVKRWIYDGLLVGYRRGGRILVSVDSVAQLIASSELASQRAFESRLDKALKPLDGLDADDVDNKLLPSASPVGKRLEGDART